MEILTNFCNSISSKPVYSDFFFNKARIRKIAVAMNELSGLAVSFYENPFNYQQLHSRELSSCFIGYKESLSPLCYINESNTF